jgi:hypothetical protein
VSAARYGSSRDPVALAVSRVAGNARRRNIAQLTAIGLTDKSGKSLPLNAG